MAFDKENIDILQVGTLVLSDILNEASLKKKLNFGGQLGECTVYVRSNEEQIPHVHVKSKNGNFETCVCLNINKQFVHKSHKDKFSNNDQRKEFDKFMGQKSKEDPSKTNWQLSGLLWNATNVDRPQVNWQTGKKPNYSIMNDEAIIDEDIDIK